MSHLRAVKDYQRPWFVCCSAAMFFFYQFLHMSAFNTIGTELMNSFRINTEQLGNFSSFYFYGLALSCIFSGLLLDHISTRKLMLSALTVDLVGIFLFSQTHHLWMAEVIRFVMGVTHSIAFLGCCRVASRWLTHQMGLAMGVIVTIGLLGGIVAQAPLVLLLTHFGWRQSFLILNVVGVMILVNMWLFLKDYPNDSQGMRGIVSDYHKILTSLKIILRDVQNWIPALYTCLLNLPIILLGALWGMLYLVHTKNFSDLEASEHTEILGDKK